MKAKLKSLHPFFYKNRPLKKVKAFLFFFILFNTISYAQWDDFVIPNSSSYYKSYKSLSIYEDSIWIVDGGDVIYRSGNNGTDWESFILPYGIRYVNKMYFIDGQRGFMVGDFGLVVKTVDGGESWEFVFEDTDLGSNEIHDIYFVGEKGWFVGDRGICYKTDDGGESWIQQNLPSVPYYFLNLQDIHFSSEDIGYIVGYGYGFFKTTDGGDSWQYHKYYINNWERYLYINSIFFVNDTKGWGANGNYSYTTNDGGESWTQIPQWEIGFVNNFYFYNERIGWSTQNAGIINRTIDGGNTWVEERRPEVSGNKINAMGIDNKGNGWAVGDFNQLFHKVSQPEIQIYSGGDFINNSDTIPDFIDSTDFGAPQEVFTRTFTIYNSFTDTLFLTGAVPVSIIGSSDFQIFQQPHDTILPFDSTEFVVTYDPINENGAAAQIIIANNTFRDSLFKFNIQGNCTVCIIEGYSAVCDSTTQLTYAAPEGMVNYQWEVGGSAVNIIGPANQQTVTIEVATSTATLNVFFEELNGCRRKCSKEVLVGLSINEDCSYSMSGPRTVCPQTDSIRFTTPYSWIIVNGVFYDDYYAQAENYKWEIITGDAEIIGADSLYEVFVNSQNEDFSLQLTLMNYPDCSVTCSETIIVQSAEDFDICGPTEICEDQEIAYYSAPLNMSAYDWKVSNTDSVFLQDTSEKAFVKVTQLAEDFIVNLDLETNIGCHFTQQTNIQVGADCLFYPNDTIFVNGAHQIGMQDGSSWENAFSSFQAALDIATENDQIWLAKGTYFPTKDISGQENPIDRKDLTFYIDKGIRIFGGFMGEELSLEERDWVVNKTILSGDLDQNDIYTEDLSDTNFPIENKEDNAYSVVYIDGAGKHLILDGLIIQAGNAYEYQDYNVFNEKNTGAGVFIIGKDCENPSQPTISNCQFRYNRAFKWGGGVAVLAINNRSVEPTIDACTFQYNSGGGLAISNRVPTVVSPQIRGCKFIENGGTQGGGVYLETLTGENLAKFTDCQFEKNISSYGGGIHITLDGLNAISNPSFYDCKIAFNTASVYGQGGGIYINHKLNGFLPNSYLNPISHIQMFRTVFEGNQGGNGGAIYSSCSYRQLYATIANCLFIDNEGSKGAVVYNSESNGSSTTYFYNATIANNSSTSDEGCFYNVNSFNYFFNSILWNNGANLFGPINYYGTYLGNSLVESVECPNYANCGSVTIFDTDPLFVDNAKDFRLQSISPAIDSGQNFLNYVVEPYDIDLSKNPRIIATSSDSLRVDLGAYEFINAPLLQVKHDSQMVSIGTENIYFDTLYTGDNPIYEIEVKNVGSQLLSFTNNPSVNLTGGDSFSLFEDLKKNSLSSTETDTFEVHFNAVNSGDFEALFQIPYNRLEDSIYQTVYKINVMPRPDTPRLKITLLDFPNSDLRDTILRDTICSKRQNLYSFQIENTGTATVKYMETEKIKVIDNFYFDPFTLEEGDPLLDSLQIGEIDTFKINFNPKYRAEPHAAEVKVPFNSLDGLPYEFQIENLALNCLDTTTLGVYIPNTNVELYDSILVDTICWGESQDHSFKLKNLGIDRLRFSDYPNIFSNNSKYSIQPNSLGVIEPNDSIDFSVNFTADEPGTYETTLNIRYNSEDNTDYIFHLRTVILPYFTADEKNYCDAISTGNPDRAFFYTQDTTVQVGDEFCITAFLGGIDGVFYFYNQMKWDTQFLEFKSVNILDLPISNENEFQWQLSGDSTININWNHADFLEEDFSMTTPLFELCFEAKKNGQSEVKVPYINTFTSSASINPVKKGAKISILNASPICMENIVFNYDSLTRDYYKAEVSIEGMLNIEANDSLILQAGASITLKPGFYAEAGCNFTAMIQETNCNESNGIVSIVNNNALLETVTSTNQAFSLKLLPNPFRYSTTLTYTLGEPTPVNLRIYNMSGQLVQELVTQETQSQGSYEYTFEPKSDAGNVYFAVMTTPEEVITKKMIFIR